MKQIFETFQILMKLLSQLLLSLKSIFPSFINSSRIQKTHKNISIPFKTQNQKRSFSSTSILLNNDTSVDLEEGWTDYIYKLRSTEKLISKSILNSVLLSFFQTTLKDVTNENLILLYLKIKLSNGEVKNIKYLTFGNKGESMFHRISYLLNYNLSLKTLFFTDDEKKERHTEIIFNYKIITIK
jgi:hypothetical protein